MSAASRSNSPSARTRVNSGASRDQGALFRAAAILATLASASCGSSSTTSADDAGSGTGGAWTAGAGSGGKGGVAGSASNKCDGFGAGGAGGNASPTSYLGRPCETAHDCGPVLDCLVGGPAGGYCSFQCSAPTDSNCTAAAGICLPVTTKDPLYYCFQTCVLVQRERDGGFGG